MTKEVNVEAKVKAIIADKLGIDEKKITLQSNFMNDLKTDSLDLVELIMEFEKEFTITIPDTEAEKMTAVGEVIDYVKKNISSVILPSSEK